MEQDNAPHVLIVEDDPDMTKMLKMLLERKFSATVEIAEDYASARKKLSSGTYDIITVDYQLPNGDGLELLKEIKAIENPPPVIMVTGHGDEQTAVESFKLGASGYVVKDKRISTLLPDAVEHALSETRLQRAEEALDFEREQLLSLFESIDEVIYVVDPESHEILYANKHLKDAFGKDLVGGICYRELQDLDEPCEFCTDKIIFKNKGEPYTREYHNPILDRDYLVTDRVIKWPDGRDVRFELAIDITERKEAELALRESERISRAILSHHHQLTGLLSPDGRLLAANAASISFVGVSEEDVIGKPFWETPWWQHSKEAQVDLKAAIKRAREGEYVQFLTTHENVDGEIREIEFSLNPVMDDKGEVVYLVPEGNDITERKRAEESLKESEEVYRTLIETSPDAVIMSDLEGNIIRVSRRTLELYGSDNADELLGKNSLELIAPGDRELAMSNLLKTLEKGVVRNAEYSMLRKDGTSVTCELSASLIRDAQGEPKAFMAIMRDITERKRAEEEIKEKSRFLESLIKQSPLATFVMDKEGTTVMVNSAFLKMYNVPEEYMILGRNVLAEPANVMQDVTKYFREAIGGKTVEMPEIDFISPHDDVRVVTQCRMFPIFDADNRVTNVVVVQVDITDRKRAERLVEVQRDLAVKLTGISGFHETLEVAMDAILKATVFDCGGVYTLDKESGALKLVYDMGLSRDFVEATSHYDADSPSSQLVLEGEALFINYEDIPIPLDDVRRNEGLGAFGIVPITDEGAVIGCVNVASRNSPGETPDESRAIVETLAGQIGQAIRRAQLVSALAESEERYRLLYESAGEAIYTHNRDLILTSINPAACEMIGYTKEELLGKNVLEVGLLHPEDVEKATRLLGQLFSGEKVISDIVRVIRKDGSVALANVTVTALYKDGEINEVVNIAHDITERKRAEEEVERINTELEGYAHTVSHDLKGPLSAIMLGVDMLADSLEGAGTGDVGETSEIVAIIDRNARNAQGRINDLLALAESGQEPRETSPVDVGEVVEGILGERSHEIKEKGIEVDVSGDLGTVIGNPTQVRQVFSNLVRNAIRYNDSEDPVIRISHLGDDDDGTHRYLVRDNGPGIPQEIIDQVFLPFTRGEGGDTGIGLSIVERIVKVYSGEIRVYNDNGACFEFTLRDF